MTHDEIISDFPELIEAHIRAALAFGPCVSIGSLPLREAAVRTEPVSPARRRAGAVFPDSAHVGSVGLDTLLVLTALDR